MNASPREVLAIGAAELGIQLSDHQLDQFDALTTILLDWNERMNLTRITDPVEIAVKHYLDSISLLSFVKITGNASLIDVGTGAGLPGLPLKIVVPELQLTLLDSVKKKLGFAEAAAAELGMTDVKLLHSRAEDAGKDKAYRDQFDFSVSRAVARMSVLAELCVPFCRVNGTFAAYKGPDVDDEVKAAARAFYVLGGKLEAVHKFTLPGSDMGRALVVVHKQRHTSVGYPRPAGVPAKTPII